MNSTASNRHEAFCVIAAETPRFGVHEKREALFLISHIHPSFASTVTGRRYKAPLHLFSFA